MEYTLIKTTDGNFFVHGDRCDSVLTKHWVFLEDGYSYVLIASTFGREYGYAELLFTDEVAKELGIIQKSFLEKFVEAFNGLKVRATEPMPTTGKGLFADVELHTTPQPPKTKWNVLISHDETNNVVLVESIIFE